MLVVPRARRQRIERDELLRKLVDIQYERNDFDFHRGTFRVRGDVVEIFPAYEEARAIRIEFFGDEIESICRDRSAARQGRCAELDAASRSIPPATTSPTAPTLKRARRRHPRRAARSASPSCATRGQAARGAAARAAHAATTSSCSRRWASAPASRTTRATSTAAQPGEPPHTLLDYFPDDFLLVIDESHVTVPQIGGMYRGDRSRKETLVEFGFRLPSRARQPAAQLRGVRGAHRRRRSTCRRRPGDYELEQARRAWSSSRSSGRPGLMDPEIEVRPARQPGRRPARRDPRARRGAASACW